MNIINSSSINISSKLLNTFESRNAFRFLPCMGVKKEVKKELADITAVDLGKTLQQFFHNLNFKECKKNIDYLAKLLPVEKLEEATTALYPKHTNALKTAKDLLEKARYHLTITNLTPSLTSKIKKLLSDFLDVVIAFIEIFLSAYGIAGFFKPLEDEDQAQYKFMKLTSVTENFTTFSLILIPILGLK